MSRFGRAIAAVRPRLSHVRSLATVPLGIPPVAPPGLIPNGGMEALMGASKATVVAPTAEEAIERVLKSGSRIFVHTGELRNSYTSRHKGQT